MKYLKLIKLNYLLVFVPLSVMSAYLHWGDTYTFGFAFLGIVPLAGMIGWATEELTLFTGPNIGGLLNATFGNATELILAIAALNAGLIEVVKATITGSIISNLLLVLGFSIFLGGLKNKEQTFNMEGASMNNLMLFLPVAALMLPTIISYSTPSSNVENLSLFTSIFLIITYIAYLLFSIKTHQHLFQDVAEEINEEETNGTVWKWVGILALATVAVAVESELLVHTFETATETLGLPALFTSVILLPIIGNAAEHASAVTVAIKNKMDLALSIGMGSSMQIALFVAPLLVIIGWFIGQPMDLSFTLFELAALGISTASIASITNDGKSNWLEGITLLILYIIIAGGFFFY